MLALEAISLNPTSQIAGARLDSRTTEASSRDSSPRVLALCLFLTGTKMNWLQGFFKEEIVLSSARWSLVSEVPSLPAPDSESVIF